MSNQRLHTLEKYTVSIEVYMILSVQVFQLSEVADLRWDGAIEIIQGEVPERATINQ